MKLIPVHGRGKVVYTIVDDADYAELSKVKWYLHGKGYATRTTWENGRNFTHRMHRVILGLRHGDPMQGDHINRNRLDNRRDNLRIATAALNAQNRGFTHRTYGAGRGTVYNENNGTWKAHAKSRRNGRKAKCGIPTQAEAIALAQQFREELGCMQ